MQKSTLFILVFSWVLTLCSTYMVLYGVIPSAHYLVKGTESLTGQLFYIVGTVPSILAVCSAWAATLHFTYKSINHKKVK